MLETNAQFESRKKDHIRIALDPSVQSPVQNQACSLDSIQLIHEALPDLNFQEVQIGRSLFGETLSSPIFISSMTAGHFEGSKINSLLAQVAQARGWAMGVGSQRKELSDPNAAMEWREVRKTAPKAVLLGNIGLSQLIQTSISDIQKLVDNLEAKALFVHTNPLQEVIQKEGTPHFKGGLKALEVLCQKLSVPVILKEVGCGFSQASLLRLKDIGLYAVDVSGRGGTHWGRIEGKRMPPEDLQAGVAQTFENWGLSTLESVFSYRELTVDYKIWASGGVRSGLDAAKLIALGAEMVGIAQPFLQAALAGEEVMNRLIDRLEYELKVALFCTGSKDLTDFGNKGIWQRV